MTLETVGFAVVATVLLASTLAVVLTPNLFHAVLYLAAAVFVGIIGFLIQAPAVSPRPGQTADTTAAIGRLLVGPFAVTFELLGVLLVVALLGALHFARSEE